MRRAPITCARVPNVVLAAAWAWLACAAAAGAARPDNGAETLPEQPAKPKPMVSVLARPVSGPAAKRLARALTRHWERLQQRDGPAPAEPVRKRVTLAPPRQVEATLGGKRLAGQVTWYDGARFELRGDSGKARVLAWADLEPEAVFAVHETLLADAGGRQWLELARLLAALPDGKPQANAALRLALELDPALGDEPDFDRLHLYAYIEERLGRPLTCPAFAIDGVPYWRRMREQLARAGDGRKALYRTVGEQLLVADRHLTSRGREQRLAALGYVHDVTYVAIRRLKDGLLGVAVADFFLMPGLAAADRRHTQPLSRAAVLNTAVAAYVEAGEHGRVVYALERLLAIAHHRNAADATRYRLAHFLARAGDYDPAIRHLEQIDSSGGQPRSVRTLIARIRRWQAASDPQRAPQPE